MCNRVRFEGCRIPNEAIRHVVVYTLHFEKQFKWQIPERIYNWQDEGSFSSSFVYDNSECGNSFISVINKKTGKIAVAYDTELYVYNKYH